MFAPKVNYSITSIETSALIAELQRRMSNDLIANEDKSSLGDLVIDIEAYLA